MKNEEISNIQIVLFALYSLGGSTKKIPTERIAVECFKLAPSRFSWRLFPQYPDIESVRVTLFDARKEKYGGLVRGRYGKTTISKLADGWIFTPDGVKWFDGNKQRIEKAIGSKRAYVRRTEIDQKIHDMEDSTAFKRYLRGDSANLKQYEITDFLYASLDTPRHILRGRLDQAKALAATAKREKLSKFLSECEGHLKSLLD